MESVKEKKIVFRHTFTGSGNTQSHNPSRKYGKNIDHDLENFFTRTTHMTEKISTCTGALDSLETFVQEISDL